MFWTKGLASVGVCKQRSFYFLSTIILIFTNTSNQVELMLIVSVIDTHLLDK